MRPSVREHTNAIIAVLEGEGLKVGDAEAPAGKPPYVVVYPLPGGRASGTLGELDADAELLYQVTCVGTSRKQAEWLADATHVLLDGFDVEGRYIPRVALEMHAGVMRDDQQTPPVFWATPRYRVLTTPAD